VESRNPVFVSGLDHVQVAAPPGCEIDELADRLAAAGAPVTWDDELPGVRRFFTEDPWGDRLELLAAAQPADQVEAAVGLSAGAGRAIPKPCA